MALKAYEAYHGHDWLTYRPSVAQCYDTLDRLQDFLQPNDVAGDVAQLQEMGGLVLDLCDDLAGELEVALADLAPWLQNQVGKRWTVVELRGHLAQLRRLAAMAAESETGAAAPQLDDAIAAIKASLHQIDV